MADLFIAGYGSVWVPPPTRAYVSPTATDQNSTSVGYDIFDRFNLGKPGAQTAYGTEEYFDAAVSEFHRAGVEVYADAVLNHDTFRQSSVSFMQDGGLPGFWMNPPTPLRTKVATDNWGDFHSGQSGGYYQSEAPGSPRYCLLNGDLVALIDIDQASNNLFIRQPTTIGDARNIPGGTYFNKVDAGNARFYLDAALGLDAPVSNPGMSSVGVANTGSFVPPCDLPSRTVPAVNTSFGRFNTQDAAAGDPVVENATGYTMRWVQWMLDVHHVDGFRLDAVKHVPSWYWDTYFDTVTHNRRITPDGRAVNPVVFGECVDGNDFCFDRYLRKPNGRASGRLTAGDAFANRDLLDINGAARLRNNISGQGLDSLNTLTTSHLDTIDDGQNNGSVGWNHIWSHDNGSVGNGSANPAMPTYRQQGWYMHAYLLFRPGNSIVYHDARGVNRTGSGFYPRQGVPVALGQDSASTNLEPVITNLVQLSNQLARGDFTIRSQDNDVLVFERRSGNGAAFSGNCLVGINDRYDGGSDTRTIATSFAQGTRLFEMTGNAANAIVDPAGTIPDVITVGASGAVTITVPRNLNASNVEHNRGFVVYAPAIPSGTLTISNTSGSIAADNVSTAAYRRRLNSLPIVAADTFDIQLTTTPGDTAATNNDAADDNAVFRINEGFDDWNGNGRTDIDATNTVVPGYEQFVTQRQPLFGTTNTQGVYRQTIDATRLEEGTNYISVVAFRHRNAGEAPLFREFRTAIYVDRLPPTATMITQCPLPTGTTTAIINITTTDRTVTKINLITNPPAVADPLTLASAQSQAARLDRWDFVGTAVSLHPGENQLLMLVFEESGRGSYQYITCRVGPVPCPADFNQDGGVDGADIESFFVAWQNGDPSADVNEDGGIDGGDVETFFRAWEAGGC